MVIGRPNTNVHAYVVDPADLSLTLRGTPGELLLSGPRLAVGYYGRPDLTEKAFVLNPFYEEVLPFLPAELRPFYRRAYRTGDLVRWTAAGQLEFLGRIDRQVKVNGVRIELGEVEAALASAPGGQFSVSSKPDIPIKSPALCYMGPSVADASHNAGSITLR
jgi:non-ribosomal peptide synthetase component F